MFIIWSLETTVDSRNLFLSTNLRSLSKSMKENSSYIASQLLIGIQNFQYKSIVVLYEPWHLLWLCYTIFRTRICKFNLRDFILEDQACFKVLFITAIIARKFLFFKECNIVSICHRLFWDSLCFRYFISPSVAHVRFIYIS